MSLNLAFEQSFQSRVRSCLILTVSIPYGLKPKEETFQVALDALALTPCYPVFFIIADVPEVYIELDHTGVFNSLNDVVIDQMHQPWRTFTALINRSLFGKTTALDKLCLSRAHILWGMYYQKNVDYVDLLWEDFTYQIENHGYKKQEKIKEASHKYGVVLPECLTSPQMKESKAYKTYLGYATGTVPPKVAKKFKKPSPSKKDSVPVPADEEPIQKGKRVKRSTKKSSTTPTTCIVIREPLVETGSKRKEKVDVARGKGIDLLSEVALTEESHMKEVRKKSLRDFHKSYPIRLLKNHQVLKRSHLLLQMKELENNSEEHESDPDQDIDRSESDSESGQQDDDYDEVKDDDEDDDMMMISLKKTNVPVTSSSCSSDLASKFLNFLDIPPVDTEIVSPLDAHVHHEVPRIYTSTLLAIPVSSTPSPLPKTKTNNIPPLILDFASVFRFNDRVIALEKDVVELKNDPLHTQVKALVDDHLDTRMGATRKEFMKFLSASLTDSITEQRSRDDKDKVEGPSAGLDRGLKKRNTSKDTETTTSPKTKDSSSKSSKGTKSQPKSFGKSVHVEEPEFEVEDTNMPQGQEWNQGPTQNLLMTLAASTSIDFSKALSNYAKLEYDFEECYKALSEKLDWENPEGSDYPIDLFKPLPLITHGNRQSVPVEFFINNDLKGIQSRGDVYSTKRILAVTHVSVMRKHGYRYLEEIVDMLLLVVHNRLKNLSGDDVADFAIALRIFTRSLVIQKQVKDLQLGVESYQKHINASFFARIHYQEYRHGVLAKEKMEHIGKEKSLLHYQRHQQGKEDDEKFREGGFAVLVFSPGDDPVACLNKAMVFLTVVAYSRQGLLNAITVKMKDIWLGNALNLSDQECSKCDDVLNAKAILMDNISNYGSDIISEEKANKEQNSESVTAELERYKERVKTFKQHLNIDLSSREKMIDSLIDDMIKEKLALKEQVDSLEQNLSKQIKKKDCLLQTFTVFKNESKENK
nr:hypothetical protein [Tanacetum cinerariifolium]